MQIKSRDSRECVSKRKLEELHVSRVTSLPMSLKLMAVMSAM